MSSKDLEHGIYLINCFNSALEVLDIILLLMQFFFYRFFFPDKFMYPDKLTFSVSLSHSLTFSLPLYLFTFPLFILRESSMKLLPHIVIAEKGVTSEVSQT